VPSRFAVRQIAVCPPDPAKDKDRSVAFSRHACVP
jgi:hypothetical protein